MSRRMMPDSNTIALWRLDESSAGTAVNINDPGTHDGTNNGSTAVAVTELPFVYARNFVAASSQYISISDHADLKPTDVSIEAWVRLDTIAGNFMAIAGRCNPSVEGYYLRITDTDELSFYARAGGVNEAVSLDISNWSTSDWHFVAATYDATSGIAILYIDGLEVARDTGWGAINYSGSVSLDIGHISAGATPGYMDGNIAEVRLSDIAKTPGEILNTWAAFSDPIVGFKS